MQHLRLRCKHCRREYIYCTYGNGPEYGTEAGCSMDYCAECQRAIDEALNKIPIKFGGKLMDIKPTDELLALFKRVREEVKAEEEKALKNNDLPIIRAVPYLGCCFGGEYDNYDVCTYKGRSFVIEWDDATPKDVHVSIEMEYDYIDKKFTDNYWRTDRRDGYIHRRSIKVDDMLPVSPMAEPLGKLQYMDFDWDLNVPKPEKPIKIPHERFTYTRTYDGNTVKRLIDKPDRTKVAFHPSEELYPFMDYEITYEKYRDEDFETIINVTLA